MKLEKTGFMNVMNRDLKEILKRNEQVKQTDNQGNI